MTLGHRGCSGIARRLRTIGTIGALAVALASCVRTPIPIVFPQVAIEDPSFAPTMEAYTAAPVRWSNGVDLLLNGEQIFPAQVQAIRSAQVTFTYAQYVYESGPPAQALLKAMSERCQAGVRGHVLVDGIGSLAMPAETRETLERAGCEFAIFRPLDLPTIGDVTIGITVASSWSTGESGSRGARAQARSGWETGGARATGARRTCGSRAMW
jgi:hypothetical protein